MIDGAQPRGPDAKVERAGNALVLDARGELVVGGLLGVAVGRRGGERDREARCGDDTASRALREAARFVLGGVAPGVGGRGQLGLGVVHHLVGDHLAAFARGRIDVGMDRDLIVDRDAARAVGLGRPAGLLPGDQRRRDAELRRERRGDGGDLCGAIEARGFRW